MYDSQQVQSFRQMSKSACRNYGLSQYRDKLSGPACRNIATSVQDDKNVALSSNLTCCKNATSWSWWFLVVFQVFSHFPMFWQALGSLKHLSHKRDKLLLTMLVAITRQVLTTKTCSCSESFWNKNNNLCHWIWLNPPVFRHKNVNFVDLKCVRDGYLPQNITFPH